MNGTRRAIGIVALIVLALGTAWALEHRAGTQGGAQPIIAPTGVTAPEQTGGERTTAPDSQQEYDRSDLLLSQG
jgi:hypothetical protein